MVMIDLIDRSILLSFGESDRPLARRIVAQLPPALMFKQSHRGRVLFVRRTTGEIEFILGHRPPPRFTPITLLCQELRRQVSNEGLALVDDAAQRVVELRRTLHTVAGLPHHETDVRLGPYEKYQRSLAAFLVALLSIVIVVGLVVAGLIYAVYRFVS